MAKRGGAVCSRAQGGFWLLSCNAPPHLKMAPAPEIDQRDPSRHTQRNRMRLFAEQSSRRPAHINCPRQPDYEREKRWSDQIVPAVLVGDVVWLKQQGTSFRNLIRRPKIPVARDHRPDEDGILILNCVEPCGSSWRSKAIPRWRSSYPFGRAKVGDYFLPMERRALCAAAKFLQDKGLRSRCVPCLGASGESVPSSTLTCSR
jgi:hypothetical protein